LDAKVNGDEQCLLSTNLSKGMSQVSMIKRIKKKKGVNTYLALPLLESSTTLNGRFLCGRLSIWKVVKERENNWFLDTTKKNDLN